MRLQTQVFSDASTIHPYLWKCDSMPPLSFGIATGAKRHFHSWGHAFKNNQHDRPMYYIGYIGSTCVERIQVDLGSTLSIILGRLLHFLGIPLHKLSTMTTIIYDFNAESSHPLGKIRLW